MASIPEHSTSACVGRPGNIFVPLVKPALTHSNLGPDDSALVRAEVGMRESRPEQGDKDVSGSANTG